MAKERFEATEDYLVLDNGNELTQYEIAYLLNHYWKRIEYEIKENGELHKRIGLMVNFLEEKGIKDECVEYMKIRIVDNYG